MARHKKKQRTHRHRSKPGSPPGTLTAHHQGETLIELISYGKDHHETKALDSVRDLRKRFGTHSVIWVNFFGLSDLESLRHVGEEFGIHQLTLEDILNVHQRPKFESFNGYEYCVCRMARFKDQDPQQALETEQISIIQVENFVFTFQVTPKDCFDPLRRRIREKSGLIRDRKSDYLVYAIIDSVMDHYFPLIDELSNRVSNLDEALLNEHPAVSVREIHQLRRNLLEMGRSVRPHREMLGRLIRESTMFSQQTLVFLNDCFDHAIQLSESIDSNREICSDLRSYHLALVGNRTNEVMKTLTIVSSVFIPLSFIAGLYGMNFENMPELKWSFGYYLALGLMVLIASSLLLWFHRRGWFSSN